MNESKKPVAQFLVKGIKCDTPGCGWHDPDVPFEEYEAWLEKPCPKCGASLLTKEDLATTRALASLIGAIGGTAEAPEDAVRTTISLEMDGSGRPSVSNVSIG